MAELQAFLQQSPWVGWVLMFAGLAGGVYQYRDKLPSVDSLTGWLKRSPAKPDRKAALGNADDCIAYLESIGCTEGVAYFKAGLVHLYHSHGGSQSGS